MGGETKTKTAFMKDDAEKPRYSLLHGSMLEGVAKIMTFGAQKYEAKNYLNCEELDRLYDACQRHIAAWRSGVEYDDESGEKHLYHAICNLMMITEIQEHRLENDLSPLKLPS